MSLLEAFRQAMREMGIAGELIAVDMDAGSAALHRADAREVVTPTGTLEYIPALLEVCQRRKVGLLIPLTDLDLRSLSRHREKFTAIGCEVMIGSVDTTSLCRDKMRTWKFLRSIGLPAIRTLTLEQFRANPFFPCFIKPIRGSASVGAGVIHSEVELKAHVATFGDLMLAQDFVPGAEYTLDIFRNRQGKVLSVVPRQRLVIRSGEVEKGLTVHDSELLEAGVLLGEKLDDVWGVINAQCRRPAEGKAHFFEINPRFGGGVPLAIAAGANLPRYVVEECLGLPSTARLGQFTPNVLMMRYDQAVYTEVPNPEDLPGFDTPTVR